MWNKDEIKGKKKQITGAINEKVGLSGNCRINPNIL